jgi:glycosyltransferase involved in cell wall biosynthesis
MRLDDITPIILTYNEEPNIGRVLSRLTWAREIVVVDSHSIDRTREIARGFPNVRVIEHAFESHAAQWLYALRDTGVGTEWVLVLDSDYLVPQELIRELETLKPEERIAGYEARFRYCICGRPLPRSIYPPRIVLSRRGCSTFYQDGHTQKLAVSGDIGRLRNAIDHDDRKSLDAWLSAQKAYARLERDKILAQARGKLGFADRVRTLYVIAPIAVLIHCLFFKGLILKGYSGWYYTYQRVVAELILSLYLIEHRLFQGAKRETSDTGVAHDA